MEIPEILKFNEEDSRRVSRYCQLLIAVYERISSLKPSSVDISKIGRGMIDKLIIILPRPILVEDLLESCKNLNIKALVKCEKGKKYFLNIYHPSGLVIKAFLGRGDRREFYRVICNPSKVNSLAELEFALLQVVGESALKSIIYRLDFCVDYFLPYNLILEGLDVAYKQFQLGHLNSSKGRTGLQIGTGNDKIIVYDKAAQLGLDTPLTRIERQLSGPEVPFRNLSSLRCSIDQILDFSPLKNVKLHQVEFPECINLRESKVKKRNELKTLIKYEGYFQARKKLTSNRSFIRDYGDLFTLIPFDVQPKDLIEKDLIKYFQEVLH